VNSQGETIAAIATAAGAAGIGVIRISGARAPAMARALLGRPAQPRHAHYAVFRDAQAQVLDHGLLLHFPAPHSFTGEDVVELQVHGSPVMLACLLERCIELGALHARPGEFSERAFLNGKIDLVQAEAIADLIASGSQSAARAAVRSLQGAFSAQVAALTESVVRLRIWIEAAIDFPEEEIDFLATPSLIADMADACDQLGRLLDASRRGVRLRNGLHVVIVGRPNAGKSSLLNRLAANERAIVTDVPGTTRDVLRETIDLDGISITLADTAGLHDATDPIEIEGIRRTRSELAQADLAILVSSDAQIDDDRVLLDDLPASSRRLLVHNKIDLADQPARSAIREGITHIWMSARSGAGLEILVHELRTAAGQDETGAGTFSARARHVAALEDAATHLQAARHALTELRAGELAAEELRAVQRALGEITGEFSSEDLLGRIFAGFCIGK
jgi:tRNA modification GTPase